MKSILISQFLVLIAVLSNVLSCYLPGVAPRNFQEGEEVELKVNKLRYSVDLL